MLKRTVIFPLLSLAAVVSLSACGGAEAPKNDESALPTDVGTAAPADPSAGPDGQQPSTGEAFDGTVQSETITANQMEIEVPKGIKIPEATLVTSNDKTNVMMADADPANVVKAVEESAQAAGYKVYAETENAKLYVGNGNAVLFWWAPQAQQLSWGPEAMKDVLKDGLKQA